MKTQEFQKEPKVIKVTIMTLSQNDKIMSSQLTNLIDKKLGHQICLMSIHRKL